MTGEQDLAHRGNNAKLRKHGGILSIAGAILFLMVVIPLHLLQKNYDPASQMMSELALGVHGGYMFGAFLALALAFTGLATGLHGALQPRFAAFLAGCTALAFAGAGFYRLDNAIEVHVALVATAFLLAGLLMYLLPSRMPGITRMVSWGLMGLMVLAVLSGHLLLPMGIAQRLASACVLVWLVWTGLVLVKS